jgi:hypothetical protein
VGQLVAADFIRIAARHGVVLQEEVWLSVSRHFSAT